MNLALGSPNNQSASNQIYRLDNGNRNLIIPHLTKLLPSVYKMSCFAILLLSWPSVSSCDTLRIWQQKTECGQVHISAFRQKKLCSSIFDINKTLQKQSPPS